MTKLMRYSGVAILGMAFLGLVGCATIKNPHPSDPYERFNRPMFTFNRMLDNNVVRPVASAYRLVLPNFMQKAVYNFFSNLENIPTVANEVLQLKIYNAWSDVWRLGVNSTIGLLGTIDVATSMGLERHHEDLGLTLAHYGYKNSSYLVIPFFGSFTVRDIIAYPVNYQFFTVYPYVDPDSLRYGALALNLISDRTQLLDVDHLVDEALDPYVFVRDAYLQKRQREISGKLVASEDIYEAAN